MTATIQSSLNHGMLLSTPSASKLVSLIPRLSLPSLQNIFHGAMSVDQLYLARPTYLNPGYSSPVKGLYLCGSGAHPGGFLCNSTSTTG